MSDDLAHDAHLRAALRHAPDHALVPPSGLSQTILAAARQAHRPVRPSPAPPPPVRKRAADPRPLRAWLRRLFAPRWAGAWAAGLVATLGLGLWLALEPQPVLDRPAVVAMSSTQPESAPRVEAALPDATSANQAVADAAPTAAAKAAPAAPAATPKSADVLGKQRAATGAEGRVGEVAAVRREMAAGEERKHAAERVSRDAAPRQDTAAPEPAAPPAAATAPATEPPNERLTIASGPAAAPSAAPSPAAPAEAATEPQTAARNATGLRAALPDARKAELGEPAPVASPAFTLLRRAQTELATGSAVWTWAAPGSATMAPFDAAARAWLSRVVQAARGRWVEVGSRGESLDALEVRWWRDGWPHATLRIEADGLRWIEPGGRIRYAPLDAATLQQLRNF